MDQFPTLAEIKQNQKRISEWITQTPVWHYRGTSLAQYAGKETQLFFKLELLQQTGSFKVRGALTTMLHLEQAALQRGVVAASAGNHAIGVAYAAQALGTTAKVIMPASANKIKRQRSESYGAEVILSDTIGAAFDTMQQIAATEGRTPIHPFNGYYIALGTGTIGLELLEQINALDAVIIPIGGGGLCGGIAHAIKQVAPHCQIYGVEPEGADAVYRSLQAGQPVQLPQVTTIAESLAAPYALPYSFSLCQQHVTAVVRISDAAMIEAMKLLFYEMKLAVEPAAAAALAALCGPLKAQLEGKRVALMVSGSNIDQPRYCELVNK